MKRHVYFIGIGGSGLSAIARILLESGYQVSGSDRAATPFTQDLVDRGAKVFIGHKAENIAGVDMVVRSSAVPDSNPEVQAALAAHIPVLKRSEFMGQVLENHSVIAVAGSHGKTTTTAMLAWTLVSMGEDPSYIIGGVSKNLGNNARAGKGSLFVVEADEYDRMFLGLAPRWEVITNMEYDHPDCYPTRDSYREAFGEFVKRLKPGGVLLVCASNEEGMKLIPTVPANCKALTYGLEPTADYFARNVHRNHQGFLGFTACWNAPETGPQVLAEVNLSVPGEHNVRNALAVLAVLHQAGFSAAAAASGLSTFSGTGRRFEIVGEANGVTLVDDYAHHPTEIRTTLEAARLRYPDRRIWAVWQPHTYSRTRSLLGDFAASFQAADRVIITEVYAARESNPGFSSLQVVQAMPDADVQFAPDLDTAYTLLEQQLVPGDVLLILSAGDANQINTRLYHTLKNRENKNA